VVVDYCDACGGVWFDQGEFEDFYSVFGPLPVLDEGTEQQQGVLCPRCTVHMTEVSYPPYDGVRVDVCGRCEGLWLDKGETTELKAKVRALQATMDRLDSSVMGDDPAAAPGEDRASTAEASTVGTATERLNWAWVILGVAIIVGAELAFSGFFQVIAALDDLGDKDPTLSEGLIGGISALLAFPVGGFFIGRFSHGFTVWEAVAAAVPAAAWIVAREGGTSGYVIMTVLAILGIGLSLLGAVGGERRQRAGL